MNSIKLQSEFVYLQGISTNSQRFGKSDFHGENAVLLKPANNNREDLSA